ncbi:extracellular catalytic domain type 2 short-chain-length polyhydroxyalkanoate depolymerase [Chitinolyticbacter albus]|uniref:extracellular catalytic domain type 2 short-chain-length polyhydroxyalkanoate depolymerase n=1 Tax=Chitinolyticbacter albus TaxID=2961951 RepID=UPI00210B6F9F|nr:PHB depolymerase family esterase [Chitinolyticbacter albus]
MTYVIYLLRLTTTLLMLVATLPGLAAERLPHLGTDLAQTSVSGLSSGAFMAAQFNVAYSGTLVGAGIVAGGPFYCAGLGNRSGGDPYLITATTLCMNPLGPGPDAKQALAFARQFAAAGQIDDPVNLKKQRIYVFSGTADTIVRTKVVDQTHRFYQEAGVPAAQLKYVNNLAAGHALLTNNSTDPACPANVAPNINNCNFMQSHDILRHIYGALKPPAAHAGGQVLEFDQREFQQGTASNGLAPTGFAYVPKVCARETCRVHVVFHGCTQEASRLGDRFFRTTGYNELADSNRIVVLYPQIQSNPRRNPNGCWDFWGYTSASPAQPDYYRKTAPQMAAVMAMLQRLSTPR